MGVTDCHVDPQHLPSPCTGSGEEMEDAFLGVEVLTCLVSIRKLSRMSTFSQLPQTLSTHHLALPLLQGLSEGLWVRTP